MTTEPRRYGGHTLDELTALEQQATPGLWKAMNIPFRVDGVEIESWDVYYDRDGLGGSAWYGVGDNYDESTATLVAAARNALPDLLAEIRRLREELATLREEIDQLDVDRNPDFWR